MDGDGNTIDHVGHWMEKESIERDDWKGEGISYLDKKTCTKNSLRNLHE